MFLENPELDLNEDLMRRRASQQCQQRSHAGRAGGGDGAGQQSMAARVLGSWTGRRSRSRSSCQPLAAAPLLRRWSGAAQPLRLPSLLQRPSPLCQLHHSGRRWPLTAPSQVLHRGFRTNREIKADVVRLFALDGEELGVVSIQEALAEAKKAGVDLVEVNTSKLPIIYPSYTTNLP